MVIITFIYLTGIHVESLNLVARPNKPDDSYVITYIDKADRVSIAILMKHRKTGESVSGDFYTTVGNCAHGACERY